MTSGTVTVLAAPSLTDVIDVLAERFEDANADVDVVASWRIVGARRADRLRCPGGRVLLSEWGDDAVCRRRRPGCRSGSARHEHAAADRGSPPGTLQGSPVSPTSHGLS